MTDLRKTKEKSQMTRRELRRNQVEIRLRAGCDMAPDGKERAECLSRDNFKKPDDFTLISESQPGSIMGQASSSSSSGPVPTTLRVKVLYISVNRTCLALARRLKASLDEAGKFTTQLIDLVEYDHDDLLTQDRCVNLYILPSYQIESPLDSLLSFVQEAVNDFRVSKDLDVYFSVLGVGHTEYGEDFCLQAQKFDSMLGSLGAKRMLKFVMADCASGERSVFFCNPG
jgi:sulfite reductase alpha subunit-like flavoprotein